MFLLFRKLGVGAKIGLGYAMVTLVLIGAVGATIWQVRRTAEVTNRVIDLRAPTAQASLGMLNGMNHSLAALRGWIILGQDKFKDERAKAWSAEIEPAMAKMKEFAVNWTDQQNIERLKAIESKLEEFRTFQREIEEIAQTVENTPASKILLEQAAPRAKILAENITKMIDAEAQYDTTSVLEGTQSAAGAIQLTKVVAEQVSTDRAYYAKNVIGKLEAEDPDFKAGVDYHDTKGAIPPPATFVRETSEALGEDAGYRYDLLSKFNLNQDMGLRDEFENQAWASLSSDSKTPYAEFVSVGPGVEYRYAIADLASAQSCVSCHNNHQDSPKKDFELGDLMGILVVSTPVTQDPKVGEILLSLGFTGGTKKSVSEEDVRELLDDTLKRKALLGMMADTRGTLGLGLGAIRAYLLSGDESFRQQFDKLWAKNTRRFGDLTANVDLLIPEQREAYDKFAEARKLFDPLPPKMFEIRSGDEWNLANRWLGTRAAPAAFAVKEKLDAMIASQRQLMEIDMAEGKRLTALLMTIEWILLGVGIVLCTLLGIIITRSITRPFKDIFRGLKSFSRVELNETADTFNRIIEGMTESVGQVNAAAGQVSSASQQLAEGASEQASSLEETSSALEQMAAMTRTNAANSKEANDLAAQAHKAANEGEGTMTAINESSGQISKIIKVIEEIAFQTNLLALNAAVEAARAGEHGKGFAVVADEVRNLAQRAAGAAKEITSLIENSVDKSKEGVAAIKTIVEGVAKVAELLDGIARASDEQAQGVEQVNTAVSQMDKVTQQNASGAEESASAAEELSAQAEATKAMVDQLVTLVEGSDGRGGDSRTSTASAAPTAAAKKRTEHPPVKFGHRHKESPPEPVDLGVQDDQDDEGTAQADSSSSFMSMETAGSKEL